MILSIMRVPLSRFVLLFQLKNVEMFQITTETVVDHYCKMVWKVLKILKKLTLNGSNKTEPYSKPYKVYFYYLSGKFKGPITHLIRQFV